MLLCIAAFEEAADWQGLNTVQVGKKKHIISLEISRMNKTHEKQLIFLFSLVESKPSPHNKCLLNFDAAKTDGNILRCP